MLKTTEPVIIMTKAELEAVIDTAVKKAVAEAMKARDNIKVTGKADASPGLLRMPQVLDRVGLKKTVIYERIKAGSFPKPIKLGSASAWHVAEIDSWVSTQGQ